MRKGASHPGNAASAGHCSSTRTPPRRHRRRPFPGKIPTEIAQEILLHQSYGLQSLQTGMEYFRILPIGFGVNHHQFRLPDLRVLSKKNQHKNHLKPLSRLAKHLVMQEIHDHSPFFCISVLHTWSFIHSIHRIIHKGMKIPRGNSGAFPKKFKNS